MFLFDGTMNNGWFLFKFGLLSGIHFNQREMESEEIFANQVVTNLETGLYLGVGLY